MSFIQALLFGIIQGITEFLPVSSSGHLAIIENLFKLLKSKLCTHLDTVTPTNFLSKLGFLLLVNIFSISNNTVI